MSEIDVLIYKLGAFTLLLSCVNKRALMPAFLILASFAFNELIFIDHVPTYAELEWWLIKFVVKDFIIALALFSLYGLGCVLLGILFIASSLFHQACYTEVYNQILDLKHVRSEVMVYITTAQLATMYTIILNGGGNNGGKRVKLDFPSFNNYYNRLLYQKIRKDST